MLFLYSNLTKRHWCFLLTLNLSDIDCVQQDKMHQVQAFTCWLELLKTHLSSSAMHRRQRVCCVSERLITSAGHTKGYVAHSNILRKAHKKMLVTIEMGHFSNFFFFIILRISSQTFQHLNAILKYHRRIKILYCLSLKFGIFNFRIRIVCHDLQFRATDIVIKPVIKVLKAAVVEVEDHFSKIKEKKKWNATCVDNEWSDTTGTKASMLCWR